MNGATSGVAVCTLGAAFGTLGCAVVTLGAREEVETVPKMERRWVSVSWPLGSRWIAGGGRCSRSLTLVRSSVMRSIGVSQGVGKSGKNSTVSPNRVFRVLGR